MLGLMREVLAAWTEIPILRRRQRAAELTCGPARCSLAALPPLSLYVHLPWCLKKCPYCDFNSHESDHGRAARGALPRRAARRPRSRVAAGLGPPVHQRLHRRRHAEPVLARGIDRLLADVRARLPLEPGCEITLEANPGTFERERFRAFRAAGVTRLSVGVQSFDDAKLEALGRVHDARPGAGRGGGGARRPSTPSTST